jgi:hypothetical protein
MAKKGSKMTVMASANEQPANQPRRRGRGRPFERGISQSALYAQTRSAMEAEVIRDLEAGGMKVSSADKLLVARYVQLLRSKNHSDINTALKVFTTLTGKYAGKQSPNTTAFDKYVANLQAEKAAK